LSVLLKLFWRDVAYKLDSKTKIKIQFRIQLKQNDNSNKTIIRSLSKIQIVCKGDYTDLYETFKTNLYLLSEEYENLYVFNFILFYSICHEESILKESIFSVNKNNSHWNKIKNKNNAISLKVNYKNLPNTTNLTDWGEIKIIKGNYPYSENILNKILVKVKTFNKKENYLEILKFFSVLIKKASVVDNTYNKIYFSFIDIIYDQTKPNCFVRLYDNSLFVFEKGEIVYSQKRKKATYFKTLKKDNSLSSNFITMDLETKSINGVLEPYCVSIFDGKKAYSFYITDYNGSSDLMMKASIKFILKRKYNNYKIYLHNFSHFDGVFLMKVISEVVDISNIKPIIRDNKIINLKISFLPENIKNNNKKKLNIM